MRSTYHEFHHIIVPSPLLPSPCQAQITTSATYSRARCLLVVVNLNEMPLTYFRIRSVFVKLNDSSAVRYKYKRQLFYLRKKIVMTMKTTTANSSIWNCINCSNVKDNITCCPEMWRKCHSREHVIRRTNLDQSGDAEITYLVSRTLQDDNRKKVSYNSKHHIKKCTYNIMK